MTGKTLFFEDITEGTELPSREETMPMTTIVKFAGASGDFAGIHHDIEVARNQGLDKPIVMGPLKLALLGRFVADWMKPAGVLRKLGLRFRRVDYVGDTLVLKGKVNHLYSAEGKHYAQCEVWIENKTKAQITSMGTAIVCLPSKSETRAKGQQLC